LAEDGLSPEGAKFMSIGRSPMFKAMPCKAPKGRNHKIDSWQEAGKSWPFQWLTVAIQQAATPHASSSRHSRHKRNRIKNAVAEAPAVTWCVIRTASKTRSPVES
jgi:hypothetical protein